MSRLQPNTWWRMPPAPPPPAAKARHASPLGWAAPYWILGLTLAALLQLDIIPIRTWVGGPPAETAADLAPAPSPDPPPSTPDPQPAQPALPAVAAADFDSDPSTTFEAIGGRKRRITTFARPVPRDPRVAFAVVPKKRSSTSRAPSPRSQRTEPRPVPKPRAEAHPKPRPAARPKPRPAARPKPKSTKKAVARSAGKSCAAAVAAYREEVKIGGDKNPADITAARYGAVLNRGNYFSGCGVPDTMRIQICAAVQHGQAVGVTVTTSPGSARVASCIATAVRGLSFPSHPRMDVTHTTFE